MPPVTKVLVGVAGSGKTAYGMEILEDALRNGLRWSQIGFCSFSNAACNEAAERAARLTGESQERLQKTGWFRTIHSAALRCLGIDQKRILDPESTEGQKFLTEHLGAAKGTDKGSLGDLVSQALTAWDFHRARLTLLKTDDDQPETPGTHGTAGTPPGHTKSRVCPGAQIVAPQALNGCEIVEKPSISHIGDIFSSSTTVRAMSEMVGVCPGAVLNSYIGNSYDRDTQKFCVSQGVPDVPKIERLGITEKIGKIIRQYEEQKQLYGRLDFADILMRFAGFTLLDDWTHVKNYPNGQSPEEVKLWIFDEAQDCSRLLGCAAERLSDASECVWWLGDRYQAVYGFAGSDAAVFAQKEELAKRTGNRTVLNRSWRNTQEVLDWGECVLREDVEYEERYPFCEGGEGSVGCVEWSEWSKSVHKIADSDTMILARSWFALQPAINTLNDAHIPWLPCSPQIHSKWQAPKKIAAVISFNELLAGNLISEQDFRTLLDFIPAKSLLKRGTKSKWNKIECSNENQISINELESLGATPELKQWILNNSWKSEQLSHIHNAIQKFGQLAVQSPSIRLGTVHSAKGLEAQFVYCFATGVTKETNQNEELCLKYVAITRAKQHYRLIVNKRDLVTGKKLFWAAPKSNYQWIGIPPHERKKHPEPNNPIPQEQWFLDPQNHRRTNGINRNTRPDNLHQCEIHCHGSQITNRQTDTNADSTNEPYQEEWWNL